jgi:murein endopeptidase
MSFLAPPQAPLRLLLAQLVPYARGCLAGAVALPINGPDWQVMRLSRNRNWGHPHLLDFLERFAADARSLDGWPGLLVGDMSQPRGGPMITGHSSHQIGLDVDIWLTPMPDRILSPEERENMTAVSMLKDPFTVDPDKWTPLHTKLIKRAASYPEVDRIFVHPAIKKVLCEQAGDDRAWLGKMRPWWNHYYHFHVRVTCPPGASDCEPQKPLSGDDGCGEELSNWFAMLKNAAIAGTGQPATGVPRKSSLTMSKLPKECSSVLTAGGFEPPVPNNVDPLPDPVLKPSPARRLGLRRLGLTLQPVERCWRATTKCHCPSLIRNADSLCSEARTLNPAGTAILCRMAIVANLSDSLPFAIKRWWASMTRFAFLVLFGAMGCAAWATQAVAFGVNSDNSTNRDGTAGFADPDGQLTPGMLQVAPDLQDYQGAANQPTPDQSGWIFSIAPQR